MQAGWVLGAGCSAWRVDVVVVFVDVLVTESERGDEKVKEFQSLHQLHIVLLRCPICLHAHGIFLCTSRLEKY